MQLCQPAILCVFLQCGEALNHQYQMSRIPCGNVFTTSLTIGKSVWKKHSALKASFKNLEFTEWSTRLDRAWESENWIKLQFAGFSLIQGQLLLSIPSPSIKVKEKIQCQCMCKFVTLLWNICWTGSKTWSGIIDRIGIEKYKKLNMFRQFKYIFVNIYLENISALVKDHAH